MKFEAQFKDNLGGGEAAQLCGSHTTRVAWFKPRAPESILNVRTLTYKLANRFEWRANSYSLEVRTLAEYATFADGVRSTQCNPLAPHDTVSIKEINQMQWLLISFAS